MLAIVLIVIIFGALVLTHEWGHFITAKRRGVGADEFGIGFPPRVFGKKWRGTLYSVNLLPLGGFVRLKGEDADDKSPDSFNAASFGSKTLILLAGVAINALTAIILLIILCWSGLPDLGASLRPGFVKPSHADTPKLLIVQVEKASPADKAGLVYGDYLTAANGKAITSDEQLRQFTKAKAGQKVSLTVQEKGQAKTISTTLRPPRAGSGFLGIGTQAIAESHYGFWQGIVAGTWIAGKLFVLTIVAIVSLIIHLPQLIGGLFGHQVPQAAEAASGPVGIFVIFQSLTKLGWQYIALFAANIAVALAAFNVFPLPALDGGRWAVLAIQKVTRKNIKASTEALIHGVGFAALIALMIIITVYDVRKFL
jgi:regulator of sigma E protease